ncbi:unnamed protein product [Strongylus vulgaris]|uniref:KHDC4/BBP-like KH-domain type I domain-containing protein n=1 Tax=Strongylus vulgaris TaxID=40348 RepID=A0A3P7J9N2_STRVU|nr:unnamed protein product [Strongylus vulgaris]
MTAKQLEQETGCKIMVRGKGSMRDKRKEEANRGKPNWEHLDDELHVLLQCEDTENRARIKLHAAMEHVKKLLVPAPEGTDELKRKQLMELAIINGTYRPFHKSGLSNSNRILTPVPLVSPIRAPIFVSPTSSPNSVSMQVSALLTALLDRSLVAPLFFATLIVRAWKERKVSRPRRFPREQADKQAQFLKNLSHFRP